MLSVLSLLLRALMKLSEALTLDGICTDGRHVYATDQVRDDGY